MTHDFVTTYEPRNPAHNTVGYWRAEGYAQGYVTWETQAKRYARQHGESKGMLANGSVRRFWTEPDGRMRQRTYTRVTLAS